jgi:hypothetical protein
MADFGPNMEFQMYLFENNIPSPLTLEIFGLKIFIGTLSDCEYSLVLVQEIHVMYHATFVKDV